MRFVAFLALPMLVNTPFPFPRRWKRFVRAQTPRSLRAKSIRVSAGLDVYKRQGVDPRTMEEVYCPRTPHEKAMQRALIQYRNPKNRRLVIEALKAAGREDLIGYDEKCLVRPDKGGARKANNQARGAKDQRGKRRGGSSAAGSCSKGTAADSDSRGKRQHGKSTGSLQRGKYGKRGEAVSYTHL